MLNNTETRGNTVIGNRFVIVDVEKGLYFAKNQKDRFTKDYRKASWWTDKNDARKKLKGIADKPTIKERVNRLTVMKLQDAKTKIAQNANKIVNSVENCTKKVNGKKVNIDDTEQAKLFVHLKSICQIVEKVDQEDLLYMQEKFYTVAAGFNVMKSSIAKQIKECDGKDLDFLHLVELGKFDAVAWAKLIVSERENRRKRRQYKDEWAAIDTLFPNSEPDMRKIKSQAEKCLETIEVVETNNRKYAFRSKETKAEFGNLLS